MHLLAYSWGNFVANHLPICGRELEYLERSHAHTQTSTTLYRRWLSMYVCPLQEEIPAFGPEVVWSGSLLVVVLHVTLTGFSPGALVSTHSPKNIQTHELN